MSQHSDPGQNDPRRPIGFHMEVTLISGIPDAEQTRFQRNLEDYLSGRGFACSLTQWMGAVWKDDTDLTLSDQCDLLSWLHTQPYVGAAVVSELKPVEGIEDVRLHERHIVWTGLEQRCMRLSIHRHPRRMLFN